MPITSRLFGERGRRRAAALGIESARLPPGQSPTIKWPVLSVGPAPRVETGSWLLSVDGAVGQPYRLDWAGLMSAGQVDWTGDIHCVTRWSKFGMRWRGVAVRDMWKSAKWICRLEVLQDDQLGFWEQNGYHHRGDPWAEERYSVDEYVARALRRQARLGADGG